MKMEHYKMDVYIFASCLSCDNEGSDLSAIDYSSPCFHQFDLLISILKFVIIYVNAFNKYYESVYSIKEQKEFNMTIINKFILLQISNMYIGLKFSIWHKGGCFILVS
jgi:hypothetical protein